MLVLGLIRLISIFAYPQITKFFEFHPIIIGRFWDFHFENYFQQKMEKLKWKLFMLF
jgi:hypothetical protein